MRSDEPTQEKIKVAFGAMVPPLSKQLKAYDLNKNDVRFLQQLANAITLLHVNCVISNNNTHEARKRLMKQIRAKIRECQEELFAPAS